jgi:plastocyanin
LVAAILGELDLPLPEQRSRMTVVATRVLTLLALALLAAASASARGDEVYSTTITIRNHRFEPSEIHVPAGKRIVLTVVNADPLSEEFDSTALKVEKVIAGGSEGAVRLRPLDPGRYPFIGEYHADTAQGILVAE